MGNSSAKSLRNLEIIEDDFHATVKDEDSVTFDQVMAHLKRKGIDVPEEVVKENFDLADKNMDNALDGEERAALFELLKVMFTPSEEEMAEIDAQHEAAEEKRILKEAEAASEKKAVQMSYGGMTTGGTVKMYGTDFSEVPTMVGVKEFDAEGLHASMSAQADADVESYAKKFVASTEGQKAPTEIAVLTMPDGPEPSLGLEFWRSATALVVTKVAPGSVASDANFRPLDVVTKVGDVDITGGSGTTAEALALITRLGAGQQIKIEKSFYAGGAANHDDTLLEIVKAYHADSAVHSAMETTMTMDGSESTGFVVSNCRAELSDAGDLNYFIVKSVVAGSPAANAGIKVHDMILEVEGEKVVGNMVTTDDLKRALGAAGDIIKLKYGRLNDATAAAFAVRENGVNRDQVDGLKKQVFSPFLAKMTLVTILLRMMLFPLIVAAGMLLLAGNAINPLDTLYMTAGLIFLIDGDSLFFTHFVAESEKAAMKLALADVTTFNQIIPKVKSRVSTAAQMMKLMGAMKSTSKEDSDAYKMMVESSKKLLNTQVKDFTDMRKQMSVNEGVAGRKKRLQKLVFPHIMSLSIFESMNAKVLFAMDSDGSSGVAKSNIFLYAAWKVTSGSISWITFLKLLVCAVFQIGAVCEVIWHSGMASWIEQYWNSPYKEESSQRIDDVAAAIVPVLFNVPYKEVALSATNNFTLYPICAASSFTVCLCAIMIYMRALEDVYGCLQSITLMAWADHYDDFTHHSAWFDSIFPGTGSKYQYKAAVFPCSGGFFAFMVTAFGAVATFMSSIFFSPIIIIAMAYSGIAPNAHC